MNVPELIGEVVAQFLKGELSSERDAANEGTARYIIDSLSAEQTAAIARRLLRDPELSGRVDLRLPAHALQGCGLPDAVLTSHPATYFRNITIEKPVLLVATSGDDEDQSLKEFTRLGTPELQDHPGLWVKVASDGLSLTEQHAKWWEKALAGVLDLRSFSLDRLASYVLRTRAAVEGEGLPVLIALGNALPALRLPRDSVCSNRIKEKSRGHVFAWKSQFSSMLKSRGCYLRKRTPAQLILGEDDLRSAFERVKDAIPSQHHDVVTQFIMESLFSQGITGSKRKLRIRCERATKKDLRDLNVDAGLFFSRRYAGLRSLFGDRVSWQVGQLFDFPKLVTSWRASSRTPLNFSTARAALQLKFVLELESDVENSGSQTYATQLVWKFNPNTVASQFDDDWSRLEEHALVFCRTARDSVGSKGGLQTLDLTNRRTFIAAFDRDRGSFVAVFRKDKDLATCFRANLEWARDKDLISAGVASSLSDRFSRFESTYTECIRGFSDGGAAQTRIVDQLQAYAELLEDLVRNAKGDKNRELLLRPVLSIGAVQIDNGTPAVVVAPWHPLRLAAMHYKATHVASLVKQLLSSQEVHFGDTRLFFKDLQQELAHPFYPEIVLGWRESQAELLSLADAHQDYSLHEPPIVPQGESEGTNENPAEGSNRVIELVERYLALHPHEQANMSVVLFNCDSARLPQAVVDKIGTLYEDEEDVRCLVLLRHSEAGRLRDLYRAIVAQSDADADAFNASEATQDFMARLRICIVADQAPAPDPKDGSPYDIVFSQDVIARHACVAWFPEGARPVDADRLIPPRWSRRRPAARDDMKSVVYLCCPVQTKEGWSYTTAVTTFLQGEWDENEERRLLPARQLDFRDGRTAKIFEETHNLGNWVVNYDELLDRRQLLNQDVRVIRYKQSTTQGRNVVISSKSSLGLLRSMVLRRINDLNLNLDDDNRRALTDRFIRDASDVSGDIVLRAAKRGRSANELMGIVLSRHLLRRELGQGRFIGWYFLDDYADWLGQKEGKIADIMALSPEMREGGGFRLALLISEAKYIDSSIVAAKRKESLNQLRQTLSRIDEAVFGAPERLDRDLWLARLSDLILDGVQFPASARINLADWRRAVREGDCDIAVRGYSHIFVCDTNEAADCSSITRVPDVEWALQEVYGRHELRELVLAYLRDEDPIAVREKVAGEKLWKDLHYRKPTERVTPRATKRPRRGDDGNEPPPGNPVPSPDAPGGGPPRDGEKPVEGQPLDMTSVKPLSRAKAEGGNSTPRDGIASGWVSPEIGRLLTDTSAQPDNAEDEEWLRHTEARTKHALQQFQLQAKLLGSTLTPNSALLRFAGSTHLTVEQVQKRRSELLTTYGLDVVSLRPEPGSISIAIERPRRRVIRTQELWARWEPPQGFGNADVLIGVRESDGELLALSPGKQHGPHTLIAGSTGSGKSVLMQNIILAIVATNTPREARIVLIDPKQGVDYFPFESLPHLEGGLIDHFEPATARLERLVVEMDDRYVKFRKARVSNLRAYNEKAGDADRLPAIWLVHDEFAEWMMVDEYKEAVSATVGRLGVKARAAGIYLVFAAQRPDANVMPMQLRANLGNRLILKVDSEGTSEIALGEAGAENLLGHGHLLAKRDGNTGLTYAQVPLVEPEFIDEVVAIVSAGRPH